MRTPKDYKQIEFHQLCALVKAILLQEPSIDDAEWKARCLDRIVKLEFQEPAGESLTNAMTQVEQGLKWTLGPRPVRMPPKPESPVTSVPPPVSSARTNRPAGWDIVVGLMAKLKVGADSTPLLPERPVDPRETLTIAEPEALNEFWRAVNEPGADRVALLRAFAEIAIVRPSGWDQAAIRAGAHEHGLFAMSCFACSGEYSDWHHVIQIQFGGSNYVRNRVALCVACHSAVHPWLPAISRRLSGWTQVGDCRPKDTRLRRKQVS